MDTDTAFIRVRRMRCLRRWGFVSLLTAFCLLSCAACGKTDVPSQQPQSPAEGNAEDAASGTQDANAASNTQDINDAFNAQDTSAASSAQDADSALGAQDTDTASDAQDADAIHAHQFTYTNLDSESSVREVRDILAKAGIPESHIDTVLSWVADYNDCMRECPAFSLTGDFTTVEGTTVDYGDYPPMSTEWYKRNGRNYHDILCRIAAYELSQDNISVGEALAEEDFDCHDENTSWLYTDGSILFGREAVGGEKAYAPFPLIHWSQETTADYFTLFHPVPVPEGCTDQEMYQAVLDAWKQRGISFQENACSLITFWTQSGDRICVSHAAVLIETEDSYLLFEKTNPESPYAATKFSSTQEVKQYLYDMMDLDYKRYDLQIGTYVILQNDRLL